MDEDANVLHCIRFNYFLVIKNLSVLIYQKYFNLTDVVPVI